MRRSLASVKAKELEIVINDMTAIPPTHMLAVFGKHQPRRVTLYPVHSLVFEPMMEVSRRLSLTLSLGDVQLLLGIICLT
jgi:hypothetical protein